MPGSALRMLCVAGLASCLGIGPCVYASPAYPAKTLRLVVGFSPSGGADVVMRLLASRLSANLGQSVIVDNRPGAGGAIGAAIVAHSAPDGYTLLGVSSSYSVIPSLQGLSFDPVQDLAPVSLVTEAPLLLVVHPSLAARTVSDLIEYARRNPGRLNFASGGEGTSGHLAGALFQRMAGIELVHVPYKGAGPALIDVVAGQVQMTFSSMLSSLPHVKSGALRALAVTGLKRSPVLPELPTIDEAGVKGYSRTTWYGVLAPVRTSAAVVSRMSTELAKAVAAGDVRSRLLADGAEPVGSSPAAFGRYLATEVSITRDILARAGVRR